MTYFGNPEQQGLQPSGSNMEVLGLGENRWNWQMDRGMLAAQQGNPRFAVEALANDQRFAPESIMNTADNILQGIPSRDSVLPEKLILNNGMQKALDKAYASIEATREFVGNSKASIASRKEDWMANKALHRNSLLLWDGDKIIVNEPLLTTIVIDLGKTTSHLMGSQPELAKLHNALNSFYCLSPVVGLNTFKRLTAADPNYSAEYARLNCRNPDSVKGASKALLAMTLAGIGLLNAFRAKNGGMPMLLTLAGLGGAYMLMRKDGRYSLLQAPKFLQGLDAFKNPEEIRKFAQDYFELTTTQKRFLTQTMYERMSVNKGTLNKDINNESLTAPKQRRNPEETDEKKALPEKIVTRFMAMDPETAYVFAKGLQEVRTQDYEAFEQTLMALKNPGGQQDLAAAFAGPQQPQNQPGIPRLGI